MRAERFNARSPVVEPAPSAEAGRAVSRLRWVTVALPVAAVAALNLIGLVILPNYIHAAIAFSSITAVAAVAAFFFSQAVFDIVDRLQGQILRKNRELSAINAVTTALDNLESLEETLNVGLDVVLDRTGVSAGLICLLDESREELFLTAHRGLSAAVVAQAARSKLGEEPLGTEVVRTGRTIVVKDAFADPRVQELAHREGLRSLISVPLRSGGKTVGILGLASEREKEFGADEVQLLERVASQIGIAVEKSTLFQELVRRNRDLATLHELSAAAGSTLELDQVLDIALAAIIDVSEADSGEIWLLDERSETLGLAARRTTEADAPQSAEILKLGEGVVGRVAESGEPMYRPEPLGNEALRVLASLPLRSEGKVVGVLCVASREPMTLATRDQQLLESMANQMGVAIKNAQLYEKVQAMAVLEERERIAHEMHDGVSQVLGYVNTKAFAVRKLLKEGKSLEAQQLLAELEEAAREVYADVREAILGLLSTKQTEAGFVAGLNEYLQHFSRQSGLRVRCQSDDEVRDLSLSVATEIQVIRIIQEALSNVRKHAKASEIWVRLAAKDDQLIVTVEDNGQGFDPSVSRRGEWPRFGLRTMRERAEAIGGTFHIDAQPYNGTNVTVMVPLTGSRRHGRTQA